jgi:hypothetical protein
MSVWSEFVTFLRLSVCDSVLDDGGRNSPQNTENLLSTDMADCLRRLHCIKIELYQTLCISVLNYGRLKLKKHCSGMKLSCFINYCVWGGKTSTKNGETSSPKNSMGISTNRKTKPRKAKNAVDY